METLKAFFSNPLSVTVLVIATVAVVIAVRMYLIQMRDQNALDELETESQKKLDRAKDDAEELVRKLSQKYQPVPDIELFIQALIDYLAEPHDSSKRLALEATWGELAEEVRDAFESIRHRLNLPVDVKTKYQVDETDEPPESRTYLPSR